MSKSSEEYQEIKPEEAKRLLRAIEKQLLNKFQKIRDEKYNPNTKGYDYEEILKKFFEDYLGGAFDFLVRFGVLDVELKINSLLDPRKNEFDVIALYKNAVPKEIYLHFVPYDAVAFITEVAQTLTVRKLSADLAKLENLNHIQVGRRNLTGINRTFVIPPLRRPLRLLFYCEKKAKADLVNQLLIHDYKDSWDILVVLNMHYILVNTTIPFVTHVLKLNCPKSDLFYPLLKALFFICISLEGDFIDSWTVFWNLFRSVAPKQT